MYWEGISVGLEAFWIKQAIRINRIPIYTLYIQSQSQIIAQIQRRSGCDVVATVTESRTTKL
jgi:hypothetical protein